MYYLNLVCQSLNSMYPIIIHAVFLMNGFDFQNAGQLLHKYFDTV